MNFDNLINKKITVPTINVKKIPAYEQPKGYILVKRNGERELSKKARELIKRRLDEGI